MAQVYHAKALEGPFLSKIESEIKDAFKGCKTLAVKIHFGEPGNDLALKPGDVKPITDMLARSGFRFFFYDTSVAYTSPRSEPATHKQAALEKGWGKLGEIRTDDKYVTVNKKHLSYTVAKTLVNADAVLVISHVKGHICSGFGGAIKNLGMGALTKESKSAIHQGGEPEYTSGCVQCKACEKACPLGTLKVEDHPVFGTCFGCSNCVYTCPEKAIKPRVACFDTLLAEGAAAATESFKGSYYISLVNNITKECDCEKDPKGIIGKDCGVLASADIVAIDKASHDLIVAASGEDVFLKHNKKTGLQQVEAAEKSGMGSASYELVEV
jgi:uncharacterized Fe-S center protein